MKKFRMIFIALCIAICALPLVFMAVRPTTVSTENRALAQFPSFTQRDGKLNRDFFSQFEKYFNDHFAFRNELVYADAKVQEKIFNVSSTDTVIMGTDGWLYYTSTLDDYLGLKLMTERERYCLVHNLTLVQNYVEARGADFVLTVPPNKNTLYGENMPYYASKKVRAKHNLDYLTGELEEAGIHYADLFALFKEEDEVLYLKRDSHWNNKGALLAYNAIMDTADYEHEDYSSADVVRRIDEDGDLNRMLYTLYGKKEANLTYKVDWGFDYGQGFKSVEDNLIETTGGRNGKTLLMSRDSFGNTLIPFIADEFEAATFTKALPFALERMMDETSPDLVVIEKVERNIWDFIKSPPIISSPEYVPADGASAAAASDAYTTASNVASAKDYQGQPLPIYITSLESDFNYYKIAGTIPSDWRETDTEVIVKIGEKRYVPYYWGEYSFFACIKKEEIKEFPITIGAEILKDGQLITIVELEFDEGDIL